MHDNYTHANAYVFTHAWYMCVYVILPYMCRLIIVIHWDSFKGSNNDVKNVEWIYDIQKALFNVKIYLFLIPRLFLEKGMKIFKLWDTLQVYKLLNIRKALK